jgi:hypothetical protein
MQNARSGALERVRDSVLPTWSLCELHTTRVRELAHHHHEATMPAPR